MKHILFDLDGTLLPMVQDEFVRFYMPLLAETYREEGVDIDPRSFIASVWKGYEAMVHNDGARTNREVFWDYMGQTLDISIERAEEIADAFYDGIFNRTIEITSPHELADKTVKAAKLGGADVYLATNPVFPRVATLNRIRWAGLDESDFQIITTYEDWSYCKPNIKYFSTLLEKCGLKAEDCLMVGNDVEEDLVIRELGVKTFLLTDTMENKKGLEIDTDYRGSMEDLYQFVLKNFSCDT